MNRKILAGVGAALLTIALVVGVAGAAYHAGRHDRDRATVEAIATGTAANGTGQVVVVEHDRRGHFPFFPVFPLVVIGGVLLVVSARRRHHGDGGCGPRGPYGGPGSGWGPDGRKAAFDEWHKQAHAGDTAAPQPPAPPMPPTVGAA